MAYVSQEKKQKIAAALKAAKLPSTFKYTLSVSNGSTLVVTIRSAPATVFDDFIGHLDKELRFGEKQNALESFIESGSYGVNTYHIPTQFRGETLGVIEKMMDAIKVAGDWYDHSDAQSDYFNTAFYIDIFFGRWDKPCMFTGERREVAANPKQPEIVSQPEDNVVAFRAPVSPLDDSRNPNHGRGGPVAPAVDPEAELTQRILAAMKETAIGLVVSDAALGVLAAAAARAASK